MKRLLVTAAGGGSGNNLIRGFRASRYPVHVVGTNIDEYYLARSIADRNYLVPRGDAGEAYVRAIHNIAVAEKIDLIVANSDAEVGPISRHRHRLPAPVFLPSFETIETCQDKYCLYSHLTEQGFRVAETYEVGDGARIDEIFARFEGHEQLWCRMRKGAASRGSLPVNRPEQVLFWMRYWQEMRGVAPGMFLLSEYLPGRDYAFQSLWHEGELIIAKTCERLIYLAGEWMPSGTSSTPRVGRLLNNESVNNICTRAVQSLDPRATGMFCIDLKEDRNGIPCITEINIGRFFMISPVFSFSGKHNMAELYLSLAFGEPIVVSDSERYGDIGLEETFLVRELDNEPKIMTRAEIEENYASIR